MSTFIIDRQHQLDSDLVQLFHLDAQAPNEHDRDLGVSRHPASSSSSSRRNATATSAAPVDSKTRVATKDSGDDVNDKYPHELISGLRASIVAIDLRAASLPSMARVQAELDKVSALFQAHGSGRYQRRFSQHRRFPRGGSSSPSATATKATTTTSSSGGAAGTSPLTSSSTSTPPLGTGMLGRRPSTSSALTTSSYFAEEADFDPGMDEMQRKKEKEEAEKRRKQQQQKKAGDVEHVVERLETLFLAKCTVAVYLHLMNSLLNATLPLADEIDYWQGLLESFKWRSMYILQTSPKRMYDMTKNVAIRTRQHIESLVETGAALTKDPHHPSRTHLPHVMLQWLQYFPTYLNRHLLSRPVRFPDAIHYEIGHKKKQLQRIREDQAECLGLLAEQGIHFEAIIRGLKVLRDQERRHGGDDDDDDDDDEDEEAYVADHVEAQVSRTIQLMEQVLSKAARDADRGCAHNDQKACGDKKCKGHNRSLTLIGRMHGVGALPPSEMYDHLRQLIQGSIPNYLKATERQAQQYYRPGWLTRFWVPALVGYFALKFGLQYVSDHRADLDEFLQEAYETARNFLQDWVWEPSKRIMAIIQHRDDQGSLQMLGNESLKSDIASLERMVLDFGQHHYQLTEDQLQAISEAVKNGDISIVMKAYEKELKTPLKGAVAGHLIQTLLIQVQKTKVDIEVAMAALDKLLKANELNFAFLAVGPSLLLVWFLAVQARNVWRRVRGRPMGVVAIQMRESLRQVERLLNLATPGSSAGGIGEHHGHGGSKRASGSASTVQQPLKVRLAGSSTTGSGSSGSTTAGGRRTSGRSVFSDSDSSDEFEVLTRGRDAGATSSTTAAAVGPDDMRALEKRVMASRLKKGKVPYKTQGLILCEVHLLRTFARQLPRRDGLQDNVMQDLRDLEESSLTVHQRLRTAARMYRTYGFLGLYH
ncbi:Nuclear control of ATPase protein 2 [Actinomortierella wolfii]|nr:Nuclear control of ATPase protein 2 [Actinomortierella wolfii]